VVGCDAVEGLVPEEFPIAQAPPGQVPALTEFVLQITAFTESPGSFHPTLKVTVLGTFTGSGESEADVIEGGAFTTVKVEAVPEQAFRESQANA
jgi:hypothetical protein